MTGVRSNTTKHLPQTLDQFRDWVRQHQPMPDSRRAELMRAVESVLGYQRELWEESKIEAIQALSEGFTTRVARLQTELTQKEAAVSTVSRYFEDLVAELTEKTHRDPKTKLMNFDWFMQRLESFLAVEQRVRWCAVGVVDITSFKWFNDNLGHAVGDQIIARVSAILAEQIRSVDLLAQDPRRGGPTDLHARFGGDEFCFLIPDLRASNEACLIAERFKQSVERHDWSVEHPKLALHPVRVDVGVVCLQIGPLAERRGSARALAGELIQWADKLMYGAKGKGASYVFPIEARIEHGVLVRLESGPSSEPAHRANV